MSRKIFSKKASPSMPPTTLPNCHFTQISAEKCSPTTLFRTYLCNYRRQRHHAADVSSGTEGTGLCHGACDGTKACTSVPLRWKSGNFRESEEGEMTKSNFRIPEVSNFRAKPSHTTEFSPPPAEYAAEDAAIPRRGRAGRGPSGNWGYFARAVGAAYFTRTV